MTSHFKCQEQQQQQQQQQQQHGCLPTSRASFTSGRPYRVNPHAPKSSSTATPTLIITTHLDPTLITRKLSSWALAQAP
ncbi:hypothetical protein EJ05DRAFT_471767, partial [Pseudovirgaria hyperparasitica]